MERVQQIVDSVVNDDTISLEEHVHNVLMDSIHLMEIKIHLVMIVVINHLIQHM